MSRYINLKEAIRNNQIKDGDIINLEEFFQKDTTEVVLTPQETGWNEEQIIPKEFLEWRIKKNNKGEPIILGGVTKTQLILKGSIGLIKGNECISKICDLYSNPEIGLRPRGINADSDVLKTKIEVKESSWTVSSCERIFDGIKLYGLYYIYNNNLCHSDLYNSDGYSYKECKGLYFIISTPSFFEKLFIDLDSENKQRIWNPTMSVETN